MSDSIRQIEVRTATTFYPVFIGIHATRELGNIVSSLALPKRVHLIADARVWDIHSERVARWFSGAGIQFETSRIPSGEASKSLDTLSTVLASLSAVRHERREAIVALGGGVTTDLAGFAAAIWQRGVPWICCPTSLEAAIDASIGGKTAINLPAGKNLVGAFHHPRAVAIDLRLISTLPQRDFVAALAESVKHAIVAQPEFLDWQRDHAAALLRRDTDVLTSFIETNVAIKARVVADDERESSTDDVGRAALNLGHTIGHALESTPQLDLCHGEAVALGLRAALSLAAREIGFPHEARLNVDSLLDAFGLPRQAPAPFDPADVLQRMMSDKKNKDGRIRFVLPRRLGELTWWTADNTATIERALAEINPSSH